MYLSLSLPLSLSPSHLALCALSSRSLSLSLHTSAADSRRASSNSFRSCSSPVGRRAGSSERLIAMRRRRSLHRNERATPSRTARGTPALRRGGRAAAVRSEAAHLTSGARAAGFGAALAVRTRPTWLSNARASRFGRTSSWTLPTFAKACI